MWEAEPSSEMLDTLGQDANKFDMISYVDEHTFPCANPVGDASWNELDHLGTFEADISYVNTVDKNIDLKPRVVDAYLNVADMSLSTSSNGEIFYDAIDILNSDIESSPSQLACSMNHFVGSSTFTASDELSTAACRGRQAEFCPAICHIDKKSLHVLLHIWGRKLVALVDTSAKSCFVQFPLARRLGLWENKECNNYRPYYANGAVEPMLGIVHLLTRVQGQEFSMPTSVLHSKGPTLILGFMFLEEHGLLVDCEGRKLIQKSSVTDVQCFSSVVVPPELLVKVRRFRVNGVVPPLPVKKYVGDVGFNNFPP